MVLQAFGAFSEVWEIAEMVKYKKPSPKALLKGKGAFGDQISSFPIVLQGSQAFSGGLGDSENGKVQ